MSTNDTLRFERAVFAYVAELALPAPVVSSSHLTLRDLNTFYGTIRVRVALENIWKQFSAAKDVVCLNWSVDDGPHLVFDVERNRVIGTLQPKIDTEE
jgi:hypothetical protein